MTVFLIVAIVLVVCILLYLLSLRGRWNNPKLDELKQYDYAHRGYHDRLKDIPENSLAAFRAAAKNGFGAELDVHLTKDDKLVVMHDESLMRMTGVDANICDLNGTDLEQYTLLHTQEPIPYLEEVLPIFEQAKLPLVIELKTAKSNHKQLAKRVLEVLADYPNLKFCIESFDPLAIAEVRKLDDSIVRGQLSTNFTREPDRLHFPLTFMLKHLLLNFLSQPDFVAYKYKYRYCLSVRLCKAIYDVQEFDWTIRTRTQATRALREGSIIIFEGFDPRTIKRRTK